MKNIKNYVAPEKVPTKIKLREYFVFLAGGITGCKDWQSHLVNNIIPNINIKSSIELVTINPRRKDFDVYNDSVSEEQIEWENNQLKKADHILFWFPKEGKCAITMFELGWAIGANKRISVGVEPGFYREFDIHTQLKFKLPNLKIALTLDELAIDTFSML